MQNIIAVVFDFDDTLAPDSTSSFLETWGLDVKAFWRSVEPLLANGWDPVPAYLFKMIEESNSRGLIPITKTLLEQHGRRVHTYTGVGNIFNRLQKHAVSVNKKCSVEYYLISSGIGTVLRSNPIAKHFSEIWASDFHYLPDGRISFPKNIVSYTDKTRFLFQISKGIFGTESKGKPFEVNKKVSEENLRVPFKHMIFVGDGYTDIPCFSMLKKNGGIPIGVYDQENREKWGRAWGFAEDGRVSNLVPADYSKRSALSNSLMMAVESIAKKMALQSQTYQG